VVPTLDCESGELSSIIPLRSEPKREPAAQKLRLQMLALVHPWFLPAILLVVWAAVSVTQDGPGSWVLSFLWERVVVGGVCFGIPFAFLSVQCDLTRR